MTDPENSNQPKPKLTNPTPTKPTGSSNHHQQQNPKVSYPNPREVRNPDPTTLREQWKFAIKQYSRWYSHAWGTAIVAGLSFFALGWIVKGSNPLPSFATPTPNHPPHDSNTPSTPPPPHAG